MTTLDRITGRASEIRAADADREGTAERLREAHAEGRLDITEFQERLERCYRARTLGELGELVSDLPRRRERESARRVSARGWLWTLAPILIALIAISAAARHHVFWVWLPLLFLFFWRMSWWRRRRWLAHSRREPDDWI